MLCSNTNAYSLGYTSLPAFFVYIGRKKVQMFQKFLNHLSHMITPPQTP